MGRQRTEGSHRCLSRNAKAFFSATGSSMWTSQPLVTSLTAVTAVTVTGAMH